MLPAGSTQVGSKPAGHQYGLDRPVAALYFLDQIDLTRFWTTTASPQGVVASFDAHRGKGWSQHEYGSGGADYTSYSLPASRATGGGVGVIALSAAPLKGGGTGVRVDVEVQYTAPHPPAALVPAAARTLEVREYRWVYPAHPGPRSRAHRQILRDLVVTRGSIVRAVAASVNALPLSGHDRGVAFSCPAELSSTPTVELTFRAGRVGPSLAFVSLSEGSPRGADPCLSAQFVVRHRTHAVLYDGGLLLRRASHLLGVRLTSR